MNFQQAPQFVTIAGQRLAYHRSGQGEPLLLLHGITTYSFIWRKVVPLLSDKFDVIALDLLGCGDSDKPLDWSYSLAAHAGYVKDFLDALELPKVHLVTHDLGGGIGQIVAVRQPDRLYDLTLVNSVAHDFWPVQPIITLRTPIIRQLMMAAVEAGALKLIVKRGLYHPQRLDLELMNLFMKPLSSALGRKAFLHFAQCLDNTDLTSIAANLKQLALPVLIIRGDADVYLSAAIAERLAHEIPASELIHIATGGHFIQEDEPEQVAHCVRRFIERQHAT